VTMLTYVSNSDPASPLVISARTKRCKFSYIYTCARTVLDMIILEHCSVSVEYLNIPAFTAVIETDCFWSGMIVRSMQRVYVLLLLCVTR